jgi:hypothetical protein
VVSWEKVSGSVLVKTTKGFVSPCVWVGCHEQRSILVAPWTVVGRFRGLGSC